MRFRDWVTAISGLAAIAVAIFAMGGVLRWSQAIVALLVAIGLGAAAVSRRGLARPSPLFVLLALACALTAIQLIPLPGGLLDILAPTNNALRDDGAALLDLSPWPALTTDVPGTLGALVFFATLLGVAIIALRMSTSERGRYRVIAAVTILCGLTALVVWIHKLFGLRALYGLYEPEYAQPFILGPLLNGNSLAGLMAVGAMLGIGLAAHRRQPGYVRVAWVIVVAACGAVTVSTVSRGASLALAAGALVTVFALVGHRLANHEASKRRRVRFITNALPIGVVAGCMVILAIYSNAGNLERQLSQLSLDELNYSRSKFVAWKSAIGLVEDAPWLGVGRGAFESSFTRVHPASGIATYSHLENEYLQAVVDWGVPGALALGFVAIWLAYVALRRWRDGPLAAGALGALTVVAIQSNVDFGVEMLGLAAPITAIAATLAYVPLRDLSKPKLTRGVRIAHVAGLAVGAVLLFTPLTTTLDEDRRALAGKPTLADVEAALERHPLDYFGYASAVSLFDESDRQAIRLLNHAMALHPTHPGLHHKAARMLQRSGFVAQATIEYATALRWSSTPEKLIAEIVARFPPELAATALPLDYREPVIFVRALIELGRADVATLWLTRILEQRPRDSRACEQLTKVALQGDLGAARAAASRCVAMIHDYQTRLALAQALVKNGDHAGAIELLADVESWQARVDDKISAWLVLCDARIATGANDDARRCLRRLDASVDMRDERRGEILRRLEALRNPPKLAEPPPAEPAPSATGSATTTPATGSAAPR